MAQNGQATQALQLFEDTARRTGIPIDDLKKALPQFAAAMQVAGVAVNNTGAAAAAAAQDVSELNKSFHDTIDSAFSLSDAEDKVANDIARVADQVKAQKDAHDKGAGSLDRHTQAGRDNAAMLRTLLDDTIDLATAEQQAGRPVDGLKKSFQDQLKALGFTSAQVAEYTDLLDQMIKKLDALPPTVTTNVIVRTSYSGAAGNLGYVHGNASGGIGGGSFPHAAEGGPQMGSTPTMMNEHGGELLHLPWGATVFSSSQSRSMLERGDALDGRGPGGGGGSTELLVRGDGSRFAELLIYVLQQAVSARGGQAGILGIRFAPTG
jgi:flagellar motor protein MotB